MKLYSLSACQQLIDKYVNDYKGEATTLIEGTLGLGTVLLEADGKKYIVIKEVYVNPSESAHTIRMYNRLPKVYANLMAQTWDAQ
jgi:hypothetical protein